MSDLLDDLATDEALLDHNIILEDQGGQRFAAVRHAYIAGFKKAVEMANDWHQTNAARNWDCSELVDSLREIAK